MNKFISKILSILLLLCFTATIVPLQYLHQHESHNHEYDTHCHLKAEINSIITLSNSHEDCEICDLLSTHRTDLAFSETKNNIESANFNSLGSIHIAEDNVVFSGGNYGRGPPQLI